MGVAFGAPAPGRALRWSAIAVAVLLLLATFAVAAVSYVAADRLIHPPRDLDARTPAWVGVPYERVQFDSSDGIPLAGWWMPAENAVGTVIFVHGYGASKAQGLGVASFLHEGGYNVLAFDLRAHGESGGSYTTLGIEETQDVRGAYLYLVERGDVDMDHVALFGWSMGAATVLQTGPDLPGVRAFIADSGFARLGSVVSEGWDALASGLPRIPFGVTSVALAGIMTGRSVEDNEPARATHDLQRPLLIIQGMQDSLVQPGQAEALREAAGAGADLWLVPGADHVNAKRFHPDEYEERVLAFLEAHVATSRPTFDEASSMLLAEAPA